MNCKNCTYTKKIPVFVDRVFSDGQWHIGDKKYCCHPRQEHDIPIINLGIVDGGKCPVEECK